MVNPHLPISISQPSTNYGPLPTPHGMATPFNPTLAQQQQRHEQQQQQQQQQQPQSGNPEVRPIDRFRYTAHQDQTTLVLGVLAYLERVENEIVEMKDFINLGFKRIETIGQPGGGMAATIEEYVSRIPPPRIGRVKKKEGKVAE